MIAPSLAWLFRRLGSVPCLHNHGVSSEVSANQMFFSFFWIRISAVRIMSRR